MRIISKFHDYYDGVANIGGHDDSIVYVRNTQYYDIPANKLPFPSLPHIPQKDETSFEGFYYRSHYHYLLFCGELFFTQDTHYRWNDFSIFESLEKRKYQNKNVEEFKQAIKKDFTEIHLKYQSPIIIYSLYTDGDFSNFELNPNLEKMKFASVYDAYTAFQKLEGFVDTHFTRTVQTVELKDVDRIAKHGFDKWSFRKEPWKK